MIARIVPTKRLLDTGRWRASVHVYGDEDIASRAYPVRPLSDVVVESTEAASPAEYGRGQFHYIGLENVEPITGDLLELEMSGPGDVRSRSKVFKQGDVLFARLRPYLRKVLLVAAPLAEGLCSTEFIVLRPKGSVISAEFLRALLSSQVVAEHVSRLQAGAALPRVSAKDLLAIKIPVPPEATQKAIVTKLESVKTRRTALKTQLIDLANEQEVLLKAVF
jgi:hypothetical protein